MNCGAKVLFLILNHWKINNMNNRQATFQLLNDIPVSKRFYSQNLRNVVCTKTGNQPFVGTVLRYLRLWNTEQVNKKAVCISKSKSLYQIQGSLK